MIFCPNIYKNPTLKNVNEDLKMLKGELGDKEARITLIDFLRSNVGITVELISGIKLKPYQEITLKNMLRRNRSLNVWGRGCAKSFLGAVFCFLQCIFEPNSKIIIAGPTFRTSKFIFSYLEGMVKSKGADLLAQAFDTSEPSKRNELYEWKINGGSISAIPLAGEKIRGFRANCVLIDEYLLMPKDIIDNVLKPFLNVPLDIKERIKIRELEDKLIEKGLIKEEQRVQFQNNSKLIGFSSASFTFENLYTTYKDYIHHIENADELKEDSTYFVSQLGYEAIPPEMVDESVINEAKNGGSSRASFLRENCAQFVDESDGYFSAKKMNENTLKDGENPTTLLVGRQGKKYILSIDPNYSQSKTSDFFAMAVLELDDERKDSTLVHGYARAGADLKQHISYLQYILTHFDIELIIVDNADFQFLQGANESALFQENKLRLDLFEMDTTLDGVDYNKALQEAKKQYYKDTGRICLKMPFTTESIRKMNQHLQSCIDYKHIWFASNVRANESAYNYAVNLPINSDQLKMWGFESIGDMAEFQDDLIYQTKKQCALIEISTNAKGSQSFDLPVSLKRDNTEKRARKDNYTALLLGVWGTRLYYDMKDVKTQKKNSSFTPFFI